MDLPDAELILELASGKKAGETTYVSRRLKRKQPPSRRTRNQ